MKIKNKSREAGLKMAYGDFPITGFLCYLFAVVSYGAFQKDEWVTMALFLFFSLIMGFFTFARLYHVTHKDEVFGPKYIEDSQTK